MLEFPVDPYSHVSATPIIPAPFKWSIITKSSVIQRQQKQTLESVIYDGCIFYLLWRQGITKLSFNISCTWISILSEQILSDQNVRPRNVVLSFSMEIARYFINVKHACRNGNVRFLLVCALACDDSFFAKPWVYIIHWRSGSISVVYSIKLSWNTRMQKCGAYRYNRTWLASPLPLDVRILFIFLVVTMLLTTLI